MKKLTKFMLILFCCSISITQANQNATLFSQTNWLKPFPPFRIADNLYYVGSEGLASYLIVTPEGNILINSSLEASVPMIQASIEKLGFHYRDTKMLLISQAHSDHAAGSALIKKQTGAQYEVMAEDVPVIESGGKTDFLFGSDPEQWYAPTKVDHVLHDGEQVKLGNAILVAHLTPGHTKGCTTWTMQVTDQGKIYQVAIVGGVSMNTGVQLVHNQQYPTIAQGYEKTWQVLKSLPCDIFLGAHGGYFNMVSKYAKWQHDKANPFIDNKGYRELIAENEKNFHEELIKQRSQ